MYKGRGKSRKQSRGSRHFERVSSIPPGWEMMDYHADFDLGPERYDLGPERYDLGPERYDLGRERYDLGPERFDSGPESYHLPSTSRGWDFEDEPMSENHLYRSEFEAQVYESKGGMQRMPDYPVRERDRNHGSRSQHRPRDYDQSDSGRHRRHASPHKRHRSEKPPSEPDPVMVTPSGDQNQVPPEPVTPTSDRQWQSPPRPASGAPKNTTPKSAETRKKSMPQQQSQPPTRPTRPIKKRDVGTMILWEAGDPDPLLSYASHRPWERQDRAIRGQDRSWVLCRSTDTKCLKSGTTISPSTSIADKLPSDLDLTVPLPPFKEPPTPTSVDSSTMALSMTEAMAGLKTEIIQELSQTFTSLIQKAILEDTSVRQPDDDVASHTDTD